MRLAVTKASYAYPPKRPFNAATIRRYSQPHPNPLLCAPWLKALQGKFTIADLEAFCLEPTTDVPSFLHSKLRQAFETVFLPAISGNRQGTVENGELKKVLVDNFTQQPIIIQTVDDFLNFSLNAMASTKHPTLEQHIQFLPVHARLLRVVHKHARTRRPTTIGVVKPAEHPSPENTPSIFATSICRYTRTVTNPGQADMEIRRIAHDDMRRRLEATLGTRLPQSAGRCMEDHAFLALKYAMNNQLPMYSLVLGIDYLVYPSDAVDALVAATGDAEIRNVLLRNKRWMFKMCPECQIRLMKARILDLAALIKRDT